jgi:hypothetical protein
MTLEASWLAHARRVADAICYEGYLLYPYRASAPKNRSRFQFGVLMPPGYLGADPSERSDCQAECVLDAPADARVTVLARFLQLQRRTVTVAEPGGGWRGAASPLGGGTEYAAWDEAIERERRVSAAAAVLLRGPVRRRFRLPAGGSTEDLPAGDLPAGAATKGAALAPDGRVAGRLTRRTSAIDGSLTVSATPVAGPYGALRLRAAVANHTVPATAPASRDAALEHALIAVHLLIAADRGAFVSMTEPPEWAAEAVAGCVNAGTWPVLAGPPECHRLMLSAPVILYDHPEVAPESAGDLFDATEIDEILTLRTLALTDAEKREARSTDPRAAAILDRIEEMPPELLERMHGAIRFLRRAQERPRAPVAAPWWDPGADTSVSPGTDRVTVAGVPVARGSRVRMRPGARRADAQDIFLAGREAVVEAVLHDVDGQVHLAVRPAGDDLAEMQAAAGRFWYFAPDEIDPIGRGQPRREDESS